MDNGSFETFDGDIADWIHQYRGRTKLSQALFAENADLTEEGIRNIERRRSSPRSVTLYKISQACEIAPKHQPAFVARFSAKSSPISQPIQTPVAPVAEPTNTAAIPLPELTNRNSIPQRFRKKQLMLWIGVACVLLLAVGLFFTINRPNSNNLMVATIPPDSATITPFQSIVAQFIPVQSTAITATLTTPITNFEAEMAQRTAATRLRGAAARWTLVFSDTFADNHNNWAISSTFFLDDYADNRKRIEDGMFLFDVVSKTPDGATVWNYPDTERFVEDFYLSVDIRCQICNGGVSPGIAFRTSDTLDAESFYFLRFSYDQVMVLAKQPSREPAERIVKTIVPTVNTRKHETNQLEIIATRDHFVVFMNGIYAFDVHDSDFRNGNFHFFAYIPDTSSATIAYDNLEIRVPPK